MSIINTVSFLHWTCNIINLCLEIFCIFCEKKKQKNSHTLAFHRNIVLFHNNNEELKMHSGLGCTLAWEGQEGLRPDPSR